MTLFEAMSRHYWSKLKEALHEYQRMERIKRNGFDPHELVHKYNSAIKDAKRYRWLRDSGHLDQWWSVEGPIEGPENKASNIDCDIDAAIEEQKEVDKIFNR